MLPHAPRIAAGCMVQQIGFLEQLLINLTIRVPPQPAQEREPSRRRPWHQGPGDADCRWNLFSMYCRLVGQVIFANWLATTSAMSGKSPINSDLRAWHRSDPYISFQDPRTGETALSTKRGFESPTSWCGAGDVQ